MVKPGGTTPLIILGVISGTFLVLLIYHVKFKNRNRSRTESRSRDQDEELDVEDERGRPVFGLTRKKIKIPKLWDVQVPKLGARKMEVGVGVGKRNPYGNDLDGEMMRGTWRWNSIKPVSVAYVKTSQGFPPSSFPDQPPPPHLHVTLDPMNHRLGSSSVLQSETNHVEPQGNGTYDKATIDAVQVSVLVSMPKRPGMHKRGETVGPLELGVAEIALDGKKKQKRRPSIPA